MIVYALIERMENNVDDELTRVLEHLLIRLHYRAQTVEHQSSQFGGAALGRLVIVQRVCGENKPTLFQLQRSAFGSRLHLFM